MEIKEDPDIKLEPDDEVDTIEYEQPLNQLNDKCTPKVDKIEPDDNNEEADDARIAFRRNKTRPIDNEQPCSSHMGNTMKQLRGKSTVDGVKVTTADKSSVKLPQMVKKTNNRPSSQKNQQKCKDCGYFATCANKLKRHMRKHTGERPFPCNSCARRFKQKHHF